MVAEEQEVLSRELRERAKGLVVLESGLMLFINFLACTGNLMVCWAVYRNHRLRTIPNIYVVTLAVSDALMAVLCMPFTIVLLITGEWPFSWGCVPFSGILLLLLRAILTAPHDRNGHKPIFSRGKTISVSPSF